jgi:hypothetical protein
MRKQERFSPVKAKPGAHKRFAIYDNATGKMIPNYEGTQGEASRMADAWNLLDQKDMLK